MITHTRTRVEPTPAPTLADYPDTTLAELHQQALRALARQQAKLGPDGPYCSPATLRAIRDTTLGVLRDRDTTLGVIQARAARLNQRRTQWLATHSPAQLGHILATRQTSWIPAELRDVITWQTLRDTLHARALAEYDHRQDA